MRQCLTAGAPRHTSSTAPWSPECLLKAFEGAPQSYCPAGVQSRSGRISVKPAGPSILSCSPPLRKPSLICCIQNVRYLLSQCLHVTPSSGAVPNLKALHPCVPYSKYLTVVSPLRCKCNVWAFASCRLQAKDTEAPHETARDFKCCRELWEWSQGGSLPAC